VFLVWQTPLSSPRGHGGPLLSRTAEPTVDADLHTFQVAPPVFACVRGRPATERVSWPDADGHRRTALNESTETVLSILALSANTR
jgi:hypothetical protein